MIGVAHIIIGLNVGGAESMLKRLIESNPASISETVVISLTSLGSIGDSLRARGVIVHALEMSSALDFPLTLWHLVKLIRQYQPRVVQTWMYHADLLGGMAARLAGCRNVVWGIRRTSISSSDPKNTLLVVKACAVLSGLIPKKIICVAEAAKQAHVELGYDPARMVVIANGFDFSQLKATADERLAFRQSLLLTEEVVIGSVGRFHPDKGQDIFVKAAAIVVRSRPETKFILVGRGCDESNTELMGLLNEHGLRDQFVLLGERNDVPVCLAAMDVFCMPSRTEGFPNGLGEAMAMGLPCVATDVGDAKILAGDKAMMVLANDVESLASGLLKMVTLSKDQRVQIGQGAKVRVMSEFSIEKARERFEGIYREVIGC